MADGYSHLATKRWAILMVDDDEDDYIITRELLNPGPTQPFDLQWVSSYEGALDLIQCRVFDAILIDFDLGGKTGIDLIHAIKNLGCSTPLILHTGRLPDYFDFGTIEDIPSGFISKSDVSQHLLEQTIQHTIHQKQTVDSLLRAREELEKRIHEHTVELTGNHYQQAGLFIAHLDTKFNFLQVNENFARADNRTPDFYPGKNHFELYPSKEYEDIFHRVINDGKPYFEFAVPLDWSSMHKSGTTYWDLSVQPLRNFDQQITGIALALVDVTERIQEEQARFAKETRWRTIARYLPIVLWKVNSDGCITTFEGKGIDLLCLNPKDFITKHYEEAFRDSTEMCTMIRKAFQGEPGYSNGISIKGKRLQVERRCFPEVDQNGTIVGITGISTVFDRPL